MAELSIGQVVLATFPFSDLKSKKLRPCFIVGIAEFNDIVLCQITSQRYESKRALPLKATDFAQGSIIRDSFIRPDKLATLDTVTIKQVLGKVNSNKLKQVKAALADFLEIAEIK